MSGRDACINAAIVVAIVVAMLAFSAEAHDRADRCDYDYATGSTYCTAPRH